MTDLDVLLRAACLDPADDLARLAYADACEEAGDAARAEFIRVQAEADRLRGLITDPRDNIGTGWSLPRPQADDLSRLARREHQILTGSAHHRYQDRHGRWSNTYAAYVWGAPQDLWHLNAKAWTFRRGFISQISLPLAAFMEHAEALFRAHPLTSVTLTDREPDRGDYMKPRFGWWTWDGDDMDPDETWGRHWVPAALRPLLGGVLVRNHWAPGTFHRFDDADSARAALSAACVAWGRSRAGLPPLTAHRAQSPGG
jgi:uncharacterized protein (TIGR02996 family)